MAKNVPEKLVRFFKDMAKDMEDGYEYATELNRILNSDDCQLSLNDMEIETLRDYAEKVKKVGEINYYTEARIKEIEHEIFGSRGVLGFLSDHTSPSFPAARWPF
ncbi:hypothetical protein [Pseudobacteroides cellulosolvens]|uniref:Uncharacterized protein n=1 Tax=Pseudobacteroides cellulosolvens ATCC 35603 = DSM 2933 TaxID=398512 RepID=A0A0L6JGI7_9FIRM|nr:hypothetical protein [Pseudobacteroides cellulosolvens]KNY24805.1 hypothetical protein Bccel_0062 [Pseudobacteroides cellulosolvens ATCC 35603 = DSM 2933]